MKRPSIKDYDNFIEYESAFYQYAKWRAETDQADDHYEQDYPMVTECPKCGGIAVVSLISSVEMPTWRCKTGLHDYIEGQFMEEDFG